MTCILPNQRTLLEELRSQWRKTLLLALKERRLLLASSKSRDYRLNLYPYLCLLDDSEYVDIMIQVGWPTGLIHIMTYRPDPHHQTWSTS